MVDKEDNAQEEENRKDPHWVVSFLFPFVYSSCLRFPKDKERKANEETKEKRKTG